VCRLALLGAIPAVRIERVDPVEVPADMEGLRMGGFGRRAALALALIIAAAPLQAAPTRQQVEAALVYKFAQFVEWPGDLGSSEEPFVIGLLESEGIKPELEGILKARKLRGHPFEVRDFTTAASVRDCQILVVGMSAARPGPPPRTLRQRGLLTIGEGSSFIHQGGVIAVVLEGGHVGFDLNLAAAEAAQLTLDPTLLTLAHEAGRW
jgi:hypothetical protein